MSGTQTLEQRTVKRVFWRIMPFLGLLYFVAFLDRVNVGYAALVMNKDLAFSNTVYGLGAGLFFIGYFVMEIPGNLIMTKVGPRWWIARILITWGIISGMTAFISTATHFYVIRFLLGVAEASFYPCIIYYLSTWARKRDLAKAVALFMMAVPVCNVVASPFSTWLLGIDWLGLAGWKWMFVVEAVPAVILGILTPWCLSDKPEDAKWLAEDERSWLMTALAEEQAAKLEKKKYSLMQAFTDRDVLVLCLIYFFMNCGNYGLTLFLPIMVKALSAQISNQMVGFLLMVPYAAGFCAMYLFGLGSDKSGERRGYCMVGLGLGAIALFGNAYFGEASPFIAIAFFTLGVFGLYGAYPPFWTIPTSFLTAASAAGAIAMINSIGNLGGFVGPYAMGYLREAMGSFASGVSVLGVGLLLGGILLMTLKKTGKE
ncbi:MAG: MFS transporter [Desulfomonilaceae bacterium]